MNAGFERVLETFQIENLKDLRREALEKLVSGLDVFIIQPTGSGKSLNFSVSPDCVRHSKTVLKCEINRPCDFSSGFSYARPSSIVVYRLTNYVIFVNRSPNVVVSFVGRII